MLQQEGQEGRVSLTLRDTTRFGAWGGTPRLRVSPGQQYIYREIGPPSPQTKAAVEDLVAVSTTGSVTRIVAI